MQVPASKRPGSIADSATAVLGFGVSLALLAVCAGFLATAARASSEGKIAFTSTRDGNPEIHVMNADGSGQTRLTTDSAQDFYPRWKPDSTKIAFVSDRGGKPAIYSMNADGTDQTRLTFDDSSNWEPAWSPDGSKIAFRRRNDSGAEIYVMNADGSALTQLTTNDAMDREPSWSPDGSKIAFATDRDGNMEIYTINANSTNPTRLTHNSAPADDFLPDWSPDGTKIAFTSDRDGNKEIYSMGADGSGQTPLTRALFTTMADYTPAWSPDGSRIAFRSNRKKNDEIFAMNADGSDPVDLTGSAGADTDPDWQPVLPGSSPPPEPPASTALGSAETGDAATPRITALSLRRRFAVSRKATPIRLAAAGLTRTHHKPFVRRGTPMRFTLSENATVRFAISKRVRRPERVNSNYSGRRHALYRLQGELERRGGQGKNRVAFSGRIGRLKLTRGLHKLVAIATDGDGHVSTPVERYFRIVRRR